MECDPEETAEGEIDDALSKVAEAERERDQREGDVRGHGLALTYVHLTLPPKRR